MLPPPAPSPQLRTPQVLVVANPANTNALILKENAPSIPAENITCMTRLDHNRALGQVRALWALSAVVWVGGSAVPGGAVARSIQSLALSLLSPDALSALPLRACVFNVACAQLSERSGVHNTDVKNVIIWGNHSSSQYPDVNHATIGGKPARAVINDDAYLDGDFVTTVQQRGAAIIKVGAPRVGGRLLRAAGRCGGGWEAGTGVVGSLLPDPAAAALLLLQARGLSSALSAASSACDHVRDWVLGTPGGCTGGGCWRGVLVDAVWGVEREEGRNVHAQQPCVCASPLLNPLSLLRLPLPPPHAADGSWVSMGVYSDGSYGAPVGIVYSFPVTCSAGKWSIVQGLPIDPASAAKMKATGDELVEEKQLALECLSEKA